MKILVIQMKFIGDVLASSIICNNLKKLYPNSQVDFLIYPFTKPVIENNESIDNIIYFEEKYRKSKKELFKLADIDRKIIFIDHTLRDQNDVLNQLWEMSTFTDNIADSSFIFDIQLQQAQALKLVTIYHELVDTLGSLFESMISNNLNHLMKYLESATLVLTVPTLIAGIWGMNTGGLPFKEQDFGTLILFLFMFLLTVITAIFLARKNYFK